MRALPWVLVAGCSFQAGQSGQSPGTGDAPVARDTTALPDVPDVDAPATVSADAAGDAALDAVVHPANWWDPAWASRMQLTISNTSTTTMAAKYQVGLQRDLDLAPCTGGRDAVRIVYNNTTEIPRVIDEVGGA